MKDNKKGIAEWKLNFFRAKSFGNSYLITLDSGEWAFISRRDFRLLKDNQLEKSKSLFSFAEKKHIILTKRNYNSYIKSLGQHYSYVSTGPSLHIVEITKRCNHRCLYCHASAKCSSSTELDLKEEDAKKIAEFIFKTPNKSITIEFQGGEPLLNFRAIKAIVEHSKALNKSKKKSLKFALVSNLSLLDKKKLSYIIKNNIGLCTSLDGPKKVHDKNRKAIGFKSSHDRLSEKIRLVRKNNYHLEALMVATKHSLGCPKEIIDEYIKQGFRQIQLRPYSYLGYAMQNREIAFSHKEYLKFWKAAMDYIFEINKKQLFIERGAKIIAIKFLSPRGPNFVDLASPCGAIISNLAYDIKGNIFSCDEGRQYEEFKIGNINNSYNELFESPETKAIICATTNDVLLCDSCVWKPFCGQCAVCNFAKTGNMLPRLSEDSRCKILKFMFEYIIKKIMKKETRDILISWIKG